MDDIDAAPAATRASLGLRPTDELILYAGRFAPQKNLPVLFEALGQVLQTRSAAVAVLCGDGPERPSWANWLRERQLAERVLLPGYAENLYGWMKAADLFVFPSRYEGLPNVVLEAMACHCPLVLSDIPEHREVLDERGAVFVPPDSPDSLAAAMLRRSSTTGRMRAAAEHARQAVLRYTIPAMVQSYANVYREAVATSLAGRPRSRRWFLPSAASALAPLANSNGLGGARRVSSASLRGTCRPGEESVGGAGAAARCFICAPSAARPSGRARWCWRCPAPSVRRGSAPTSGPTTQRRRRPTSGHGGPCRRSACGRFLPSAPPATDSVPPWSGPR